MPTRNIVPRANGEGNIGTTNKKWSGVYANTVMAGNVEANTVMAGNVEANTVMAGNVEADTVTVGNVEADTVTVGNVDVFFMLLKRNKAYKVGDIAYSPNLPSWARLECVVAGTTGDTEPDFSTIENGGGLTNDGTVTFIVDDIRDMTRVGAITASLYLPEGYLLADGSTKNRADYPRLVNLIEKYNLWTDDTENDLGKYGKGDNSTTFILPNLVGRHIKFGNTAGVKIEAGLPNIIGGWTATYPDAYRFGKTWSGWNFFNTWKGALKIDLVSNTAVDFSSQAVSGDSWWDGALSFDASKSNSIYGASSTVQPPSIQYLPIIRY